MQITRREFSKLVPSAVAVLGASKSLAAVPYRRKEISRLTAAEISSFRAGVTAMQALPKTDPKSWLYQAGVHGAPFGEESGVADAATYWNQCEHGNQHFLSWHRWYLLFWEEIVRQLSGNASFALPSWNYLESAVLPEPLRNANAGGTANSLHDATRAAGLNDGTASLSGLHDNALSEMDFLAFSPVLSSNPHNRVHNQIAGNMGDVDTAARDPVFWLHHANIDRMWAAWVQAGHANPGAPWVDRNYPFQSLSGPRTIRVGDGGSPEALGYTYDPERRIQIDPDIVRLLRRLRGQFRFIPPRPFPLPRPGPDPQPWRGLMGVTKGIELDGRPAVLPLPVSEKTESMLAQPLRDERMHVALRLHDVRMNPAARRDGFYMQVLIASSAKDVESGELRDIQEIGSFGSFEISAQKHGHAGHAKPDVVSLRLAVPARARKTLLASLKSDPALVFVRRGLVDRDGNPAKFDIDKPLFRIGEVRLETAPPARLDK